MFPQWRTLLLLFMAMFHCRADLDPAYHQMDDERPEDTMMPNERETIADCHLRHFRDGRRDLVGPAFAAPAFLTEFAHIGAIGWTGPDGWIDWACGGSLIWSNFILTAAHCTANDDNIAPDVARFGDLNLRSADDDQHAQQFRIVNIIRHPSYRFSGKYYDIALMQLERNVTVHETVAPACLWLDDEMRFTELESAGWGKTGFAEEKTPILLKVTLKPLENDDCATYYSPTSTRGLRKGLEQHHICAGDAKMDTCPGDSGGPLQVRLQHNNLVTPFLIGLTSFGLPCGQSLPGVYTRVAPFRGWIVETLQRSGAPEVRDDHFEPQTCALRHVDLRQLAISRVIANESGVFETFDHNRQYITGEFMNEIVQLGWPDSVVPVRNNCMGSIIDRDTIITLADCTTHAGVPPTHVVHRARIEYNDYRETSYRIQGIVVHPNHTDGSYYNNIAVVKINDSIDNVRACVWGAAELPDSEMEIFAVGRTDLNIYQYRKRIILNPSVMRLLPRVYARDNDNCTLAKQYRNKLSDGLLDQHLCFGNDPFLVPQVCDLTQGGPLQRYVTWSDRYYKYVYGLSLFGRDCGYGQPAVAVRLQAHLGWLEQVLLPNRTARDTAPSEWPVSINPDLELFDRCDFRDESVGLCVPVERCRGLRDRVQRRAEIIYCSNETIVCCPPKDVLDDSQLEEGSQQIERCEQLYDSFRERSRLSGTELTPDPRPHLAEVTWKDDQTGRASILCLGNLITTDTVLVTAACARIEGRAPTIVRLGSIHSLFEQSSITSRLGSVLVHPRFDARTRANNLALLKLASPIEPTVAAFPVCLWRNATHTPLVSKAITMVDKQLRENDIHPMYASDCERELGVALHEGQLCLRPERRSGITKCVPSSPVYWRRKTSGKAAVEFLVGLYSHGSCTEDGYIITTRISAYVPWIMENV